MLIQWKPFVAIFVLCTLLCVRTSNAVFEANKCLSSNAFYNDTSLLCQCNQGYKGLGDLCCDDNSEWSNCNIGGDPWLSTFDGTSAPYNWPCVSRVAVATGTTTGSGNKCTVEVMTSATTVEKGAEYPDRLAVAFTIDDGEKKIFKLVGNTIQRPGDSGFYPSTALYRQRLSRMFLSGELIRIGFVTSRHIWTITGCDTKITFRAAQDTEAEQYSRPGVCMSVKKTSQVKPLGLVGAGDVCSASRGNSLENLPYNILVDVLKDYGMVGQESRAIHQEYQPSCDNVGNTLAVMCANDPGKIETAVKSCAAILYNGAIRMCMSLAGARGPEMVGFFSSCLEFQCRPSPDLCSAVVDDSNALKTCFPAFCRL